MPGRKSRKKISLSADNGQSRSHQPQEEFPAVLEKINQDGPNQQELMVLAQQPPPNWPSTIPYLTRPRISPYTTDGQKKWLDRKPATYSYSQISTSSFDHGDTAKDAIPIIELPTLDTDSRIAIRLIDDEKHPAHGQRGLFAVRDLEPGTFVVPYIGYVHSSTTSETIEAKGQTIASTSSATIESRLNDISQGAEPSGDQFSSDTTTDEVGPASTVLTQPIGSWDSSSYDLNLHRDEDIELAIDAAQMGNEARFCNDYRGVPAFIDPSAAAKNEADWNRKAKRAAKTWGEENTSTNGERGGEGESAWGGNSMAMAIPNAEFRDVWFEWSTEEGDGKTEMTEGGNYSQKLEQTIAQLNINSKDNTLAQPQSPSIASRKQNPYQPKRKRTTKTGMRGVAIFVLPAGKSGKRKNGIRAGQEVLVSYGKGFWAHHEI
ncbi:hypothetical protein H2198_009767 [Neophaeococcomyces mojaviensis]|uniref:Uncharacterized protein n=1 Tax=Neophaeococcomyces mojaviensis TaxID=3383035 RepID=A0ACC2ZTH7_9EURO|nr:hypothetical protein H2198_009767 [Knufia sp. JES_112]